MSEHFEVAVLGMGPAGEVAAGRLLKAGKRVAVIERELIGGECAYWACIPSKTLLRPAEAKSETARAAGVSEARLDWRDASDYRDYMIRHLDDAGQVDGYTKQGATVFKGEATITGPGRLQVGERELSAEHIIIATGSDARIPELDGREQITAWTNRETFTATQLPGSAVIVGGGAVGVETATFLSRFGVSVTLLNRGPGLLQREEPRVGELAQKWLQASGVEVRLGVAVTRGRRDGSASVLELEDGTSASGEVVVFATGRVPSSRRLGFESAGVLLGEHGEVQVDEHCAAGENIWAIGDVTGIMPFTHVAKYQGRLVADAILGKPTNAHYDGIPRVVFGEPEIAAAGLTAAEASAQGLRTASTELDLAEAIARPWTYERDPAGHLGLLADVDRGILVGAWAVAPMAGEWIHQASLAIRAGIPLSVLRDQVAQFPTYSEGYLAALDQLAA